MTPATTAMSGNSPWVAAACAYALPVLTRTRAAASMQPQLKMINVQPAEL